MRDLTDDEWERVGDAIVEWTGKSTLAWPQIDDRRVVARFGSKAGEELLPLVRELYDDFYASDARWKAGTLQEMAAMASADFRRKYPRIKGSAVDALAWCYTFDYK